MINTPLSVRLWRDNTDLADACLRHPFVRGLADGSLPTEVFARYVAQDVYYLKAFFRAYAFAAGRSEGRHELAVTFHRLMGGVLEELEMHAGHAARLGIDALGAEPSPTTAAYVDLLLDTAWRGTLGEIMVVMTPCMRLYAHLGRALAAQRTENHPYGEWIDAYSSEEMEQLAAELEGLLDEFAENSPRAHELYRLAMEYELDFFSASLGDVTVRGAR